jgi:hypothetical protein
VITIHLSRAQAGRQAYTVVSSVLLTAQCATKMLAGRQPTQMMLRPKSEKGCLSIIFCLYSLHLCLHQNSFFFFLFFFLFLVFYYIGDWLIASKFLLLNQEKCYLRNTKGG